MSGTAEDRREESGAGLRVEFRVRGLDCVEEVALIRGALAGLPGVRELGFDVLQQRLAVRYDPASVDPPALVEAVARTGLSAEPWQPLGVEAPDRRPALLVALAGTALLAGSVTHLLAGGTLAEALAGHAAPPLARAFYLLAVLCGGLHDRGGDGGGTRIRTGE